jgi:hypothetical protein
LNFGQTIWDKYEVYWEYLQEWIWEHVGNLRILWEHDENTLKTRQKNKKMPLTHPLPPKKEKNLTKFLFSKLFMTIFLLA